DAGAVVLRNLTDEQGWPAVGEALLVLAVMLLGGAAAEYGMARLIGPLPAPHADAAETYSARLPAAAVRLLIRLVRLVAFAVVAFALSFGFYEMFHPLRELLLAALAWVMAVRLWTVVSRSLLAPATPAAR